MTESEIAECLYKIITNPHMNVPANEVQDIFECQQWLKEKINGVQPTSGSTEG